MIRRVMSLLIALSAVVAALVVLPAATAQAAACANAWNASAVYTGGQSASYNGRNYTAKWWTQNERPGSSDVWADQGACGGGGGEQPSGFVVSEAQFNQMFPNRNSFYTYSGLTAALSSYPAFANTGSDEVKKREAAAFLANVSHETGGLVHIKEVNEANYPHYCDRNQPYGCPAGQAAYYGRGPIQLSWNFNYKAAGDALGIDLLNNPYLVEQNASVAWRTGLWYWNTQSGPGTMTPHNAIVNNRGFGETIRSINGSIECNGGNPAQVQSRIDKFTSFTQILGTTTGSNLYC
ncbi:MULTISPECIES: glycoside hydrolase family 19 protein [Streptomyces]|uniref:Chitinase n=2 Tax=Streptomyces TaxID=1883 RepID=A0ACC7XUP1_9ACTN|nr:MULTISPECIES: glycoside hydrolase family 19 protein [Streptomyces]MBF4132651.1 chitinase [Streptomyces albidoflavus]NUV73421.1 chitinase [Streptomyces fungicidicus]PAX82532.1 chitinase [Streptomyces albidoflavus]PBO15359.1 chitinase [Streptomyces albidoflavus]PBO20777.1 chitinase [Streptomyces albidoflavus]